MITRILLAIAGTSSGRCPPPPCIQANAGGGGLFQRPFPPWRSSRRRLFWRSMPLRHAPTRGKSEPARRPSRLRATLACGPLCLTQKKCYITIKMCYGNACTFNRRLSHFLRGFCVIYARRGLLASSAHGNATWLPGIPHGRVVMPCTKAWHGQTDRCVPC